MASGIPKEYYKYALLAGLGIGALIEHENLDIAYHTLGRDMRAIARYGGIIREYRRIQRLNLTVPDYLYQSAKKFGDKVRSSRNLKDIAPFFKHLQFANAIKLSYLSQIASFFSAVNHLCRNW